MTPDDMLAPGLRRIVAPNPSPMTERGTNTYLIGEERLAVIDPGPTLPAHLETILSAIGSRKVETILVTHAHLDHSPLARPLSKATGAPVLAYGDALAGRSAVMTRLAEEGLAGGGEGVDAGFTPDQILADGDIIHGPDWTLEALWTPGHFGNHLCFALGDVLFTGDLVMGWASSLVSPPDGDLSDFMASCRRIGAREWSRLLPGHGEAVEDAAGRIAWLIAHRESREAQILAALTAPLNTTDLTRRIYTDVAPALLPAAERNVFAHLVDLHGRGRISASPLLSEDAIFSRIE